MTKDVSSIYYRASEYRENDGSVTLALDDLDLAVNGVHKMDALSKMAYEILEYAEDYYENFTAWYASKNRRQHLPYVLKALILNDTKNIEAFIECRHGEV